MAHHRLDNYIKTYRKRSALTQKDVAYLLGCQSGTKISRYEKGSRLPSLEAALALEIALQTPVRELFAGLSEDIQYDVEKRARRLARKLTRAAHDPSTLRKRASIARILTEA